MADDELKCPGCGAKVYATDNRCMSCGAELEVDEPPVVIDPTLATREGDVEPDEAGFTASPEPPAQAKLTKEDVNAFRGTSPPPERAKPKRGLRSRLPRGKVPGWLVFFGLVLMCGGVLGFWSGWLEPLPIALGVVGLGALLVAPRWYNWSPGLHITVALFCGFLFGAFFFYQEVWVRWDIGNDYLAFLVIVPAMAMSGLLFAAIAALIAWGSRSLRGRSLHEVAREGDAEAAGLLLEVGADANAEDRCDWTPLHCAAEGGQAELAGLLLDKGADVNARGDVDWTPLHRAADAGHVDVAQVLLEAGADVNARAKNGQTSMAVARTEEMKSLLRQHEGEVVAPPPPVAEPEEEAASTRDEQRLWHYQLGGRDLGPVSWAEIEELLADTADAEELLVAREGDQAWRPAAGVIRERARAEAAARQGPKTTEPPLAGCLCLAGAVGGFVSGLWVMLMVQLPTWLGILAVLGLPTLGGLVGWFLGCRLSRPAGSDE